MRGTVEDIRRENDIVEVISEYVPLKRSGNRYRGLCPFHMEKTPSFYVDPEKQLFHCFGCNAGGDVISFVMMKEGVGFADAVRILARRKGIELERFGRTSVHSDLYRLNEFAASFFRGSLSEERNRAAMDYLRARGIGKEAMEAFGIGYAPPGWNEFLRAAKRAGFEMDLIVRSGLVVGKEDGYYDRFRDRIMFPIRSVDGRIVGFGGRAISNSPDIPKYINSPETPIYSKRKVLYGMDLAKRWIMEREEVVIVEGYLDMISAYQAGVTNVVASLGTSLTKEQVELLRRWAKRAIIAYDSDEAGKEAVLRGLRLFEDADMDVMVASIPEGHDPDSLIREVGADAFKRALEDAKPLFDFELDLVKRRYDISTEVGKARAVKAMARLLGGEGDLSDPIVWRRIKKTAQEVGLEEGEVREIWRRSGGRAVEEGGLTKRPVEISIEKEILFIVLKGGKEEMLFRAYSELSEVGFEEEAVERIFSALVSIAEEKGRMSVEDLMDRLEDLELKGLCARLLFRERGYRDLEGALSDLLRRHRERRDMKRFKELQRELGGMLERGEPVPEHITREFRELASRLKGISPG
jgi:DNA primase